MGSYVVLARKWRPKQFSDVVGQTQIVRTLDRAIRMERIHQAYLFTGSRGVGKTSVARIFAKAIRCENRTIPNKSEDWITSCDNCSSCNEISRGSSVDVLEIDGASNNGVDSIRDLRENAKFLPSSGKTKIYIIDEVHMLTTAAFNALLKTLEEPPPHLIFLFATTEPHKIPATILSRVQRFDFRRVATPQIESRLREILTTEGKEAEPGAIHLVARAADGSMRDALSLLDQVIAYSEGKITGPSVRECIGLVESHTVLSLIETVLKRDTKQLLKITEEIHAAGHDLKVLSKSLLEFLHTVILAKVEVYQSGLLDLTEDEKADVKRLATFRPLEDLELFFQVLHHGIEWIARAHQPKIILDILLIKCATAESLVPVEEYQSTGSLYDPSRTPAPSTPTRASETLTEKKTGKFELKPSQPARPSFQWQHFIQEVKTKRPYVGSILEHASRGDWKWAENRATLAIVFSANTTLKFEQLNRKQNTQLLIEIAESLYRCPVEVLVQQNQDAGESLAEKNKRIKKENLQKVRRSVEEHPIIQEAKSLFGGTLSEIQVNPNADRQL